VPTIVQIGSGILKKCTFQCSSLASFASGKPSCWFYC